MRTENSSVASHSLEFLFHPQSIAIVGISSNKKWSGGQLFLDALLAYGFKGKIYPVGLSGGETSGLKIYRSIKEIPDNLDYVISAIPARHTPQLIEDCAAKGVKSIHMFTAGFSEIGDEDERKLEAQISAMARQRGIRVLGPNCMGIYCPKTGLAFDMSSPRESGHIGFSSQSGAYCREAMREGAIRGLHFSKMIHYGNGCDLNESDFIDYLTHDPETRIVIVYVEGVKDGRRFFQVLKEAAKTKPVIVYKGGTTEFGNRAAASHTGAMAGSASVWQGALKQAGAIQVDTMDELVDMVELFSSMSPPKGKNIAIVGIGGGACVQAADACANAGLNVPRFPPEVRQKLLKVCATEAGGSFKNPVDLWAWRQGELVQRALEVVAGYDQIDVLLIQIPIDLIFITRKLNVGGEHIQSILNLAKEINSRTAVVLSCVTSTKSWEIAAAARRELGKAGFSVFPSTHRAVKAISRYIQYHQREPN